MLWVALLLCLLSFRSGRGGWESRLLRVAGREIGEEMRKEASKVFGGEGEADGLGVATEVAEELGARRQDAAEIHSLRGAA